jgi:SAM-dependent methyltransferase
VVLDRALRAARFDPLGRRVLDVGCGSGFFTAYYLARGALLTGVDITPTSVQRLSERHPEARFVQADVSEAPVAGRFDLINAFDVLYHITDDARWERAIAHLSAALDPGGLLLVTDAFRASSGLADHNRMRPLSRYRDRLAASGLEIEALYPTHVLLNRELGAFRFLNRLPALLYAFDRTMLAAGAGPSTAINRLLVARRR